MEPITREEALAILKGSPVAHIGVIWNEEPYVAPMSYVVDGNRILFRTMAGKKLEAMRANPTVCIEVSRYDDETGDWVSVIVRGTAREAEDDHTGDTTVTLLLEKYRHVIGSPLSPGGIQPITGLPYVVEVIIEDVTGMSSGRGWAHRTKPGRL